jgi:hypothetical protein
MAKRIRANASRRKDHRKHQYDHAVEMVKKQSPATEREEASLKTRKDNYSRVLRNLKNHAGACGLDILNENPAQGAVDSALAPVRCSECNGTGEVETLVASRCNYPSHVEPSTCPRCEGKGQLEAVGPKEAQELNDLAAMRTEIDRLECLLKEAQDGQKALQKFTRIEQDRAEAAELRLRKVCDALGLSAEQATKIATGK